MKSTGTFQGLTALGWLGIAGLQHFYVGKPIKGLVWFFTFGLFFLGTVYDHLSAGQQVAAATPPPVVRWHPESPTPPPPPAPVVVHTGPSVDTSAVTVEQIKAIAGGGLASALREIDKLRYDRLIDDAEFAALKAKLLKDYS